MILYPAIDLKDGKCVRLVLGDMEAATVFSNDPAAQALEFVKAGATYLHLVDLNGAFAGKSINGPIVEAILKKVNIPCQLGGGIRSLQQIEDWLSRGITRVILGSVALTNPDLVKEAARKFPDRIVLGLDERGGKAATEGWAKQSNQLIKDIAKLYEGMGIAAIIHTDIERDGIMAGLNFAASTDLANHVKIPVIASGGCKNIEDIKMLKTTNLAGAVIGRALYNGGIDLTQAIELLSDA